MTVRAAGALATAGVLIGLAAPWTVAAGQEGADEIRAIEDAARLEGQGDFDGAERLLLGVVERRPASAPALLALERVLRVQGRLDQLPARVEAGLGEEPESALLNHLLVRTYAALDRAPDLEAAGSAWIAAVPTIETPYRELARIWVGRGDYERARALLEEGRRKVGSPDALALELGDLYARLGEPGLAAREWDRAIGAEARGLNQVRRALRSLPDGGASVLPPLVERLSGGTPAGRERRAAAVDLAVTAGLERPALEGAVAVVADLDGPAAGSYLIDLARRAEGARAERVAHWAYGELIARDGEGAPLAIQTRYVELSLALGETSGPAAEYLQGTGAGGESESQGRQTAALRVELLAAQDAGAADGALRDFRRDHPEAPEADRLTALVTAALLEAGRLEDADRLLKGIRGPRSALVRGHRALVTGDSEAARSAYMAAAPALTGAEATRILSLVTLLARVSPRAGALLGEAMDLAGRGDPGAALDRIVAGSAERALVARDRAALLEFAAAMADGHELPTDAERIRRTLVSEHARSGEAPAALLALARTVAVREGGREEARELLERLIIEHPRSALVPQARRELTRLGSAERSMKAPRVER